MTSIAENPALANLPLEESEQSLRAFPEPMVAHLERLRRVDWPASRPLSPNPH